MSHLFYQLFLSIFLSHSLSAAVIDYSVAHYLQHIHSELEAFQEQQEGLMVHLVIGNQSADMDSIVSAIAFASANKNRGLYVPLINIPRHDLSLRKDVIYVLNSLQIDPKTLLYKEDLPFLQTLAERGFLRVTLVDHNRVAPDQEFLKCVVERVIDHHHDENDVYPFLEEKRVMQTKSNATLVAELILPCCSSEEAYLLLAAILLDTNNLRSTTEDDSTMAALLKKRAGVPDTDPLFDILSKKRHDLDQLTPELLLRKDYKLYKEGKLLYGMASIPKGISWNIGNCPEWKEAFHQRLETEQIHLLIAKVHEGEKAVLIVYIPDLKLQEAFLAHLKETKGLNAILTMNASSSEEGLFFFALQPSLARKALQPLFSFEGSLTIQNAI